MILGIDQSLTHTGLCIIDKDKKNINAFGIKTNNKKLNQYERIAYIANEIEKVILDYKIEKINIEGLAFGVKGMTLQILAGLQYTILFIANRLNIEYEIIPPKTLKKKATGKGNATKKEMSEIIDILILIRLSELSEYKINSKLMEDIVDAYHLAIY